MNTYRKTGRGRRQISKSFRICSYKKQGGGGNLWLTSSRRKPNQSGSSSESMLTQTHVRNFLRMNTYRRDEVEALLGAPDKHTSRVGRDPIPNSEPLNFKLSTLNFRSSSSGLAHGLILRQFGAQAPLQFLAQLGDFHSRHHDEFARQHLARIIVVRQLAAYPAILAILIPAEAPVRNRLRADELKAPQQRIPLRYLKLLPQQRDLDKFFVRTKGFRHDWSNFRGPDPCWANWRYPHVCLPD